MSEPAASTVLYEVKDRVATVTLNRPERHNGMNYDMCVELHDTMLRAEADKSVSVIVFTGAGKSFCVGADIATVKDSSEGVRQSKDIGKLFWQANVIQRADYQGTHCYFPLIGKPIICMINGAAAGVGVNYAAFSDIRFAAEDVTFAAAYVRRGIAAEWGSAWLLPKLMGHANAADFLLSGRKIKAPEAKEMGLVNRVYPREKLAEETYAYAAEMAQWCPPHALKLQKRQLWESYFQSLSEANMMFKEFSRIAVRTEDIKEAMASFIEKRTPNFKGK
ncbi:MAG TPA: enoyl-CoA hydratase-related protein [Burkholderiales bacterium]|nr:enoyl-CoA hydratase-related protein [Burkholderiales bacterium]